MLKINNVYSILNDLAPFEISEEVIKNGGYDNSGILINTHSEISKILFSLDLSLECVNRAKRLGCDTIITHHPAIYTPIKELSVEDASQVALVKAIEYKINVISMHLNLDFATNGIDFYLAKCCGGEDIKVIEKPAYARGYGSEFTIKNTTLGQLVKRLKDKLKTNKITVYGSQNLIIDKVASFCGGGSSTAVGAVEKGLADANVIVTSDMAHHQIKQLVESGKAIVLLTHYSSENYGFNQFYVNLSDRLGDGVKTYYFEDKRFL